MKSGDKITIEQVLQKRKIPEQDQSAKVRGHDKLDSKEYARTQRSKERSSKNQSYIGVDKRRYQTSKREEIKLAHHTSYAVPFSKLPKGSSYVEHLSKKNEEGTGILNIVSEEKIGFHITDLIENNKKPKLMSDNVDQLNKTSMFDHDISRGSKNHNIPSVMDLNKSDDRYMIKNFRIVDTTKNETKINDRNRKNMTAAPISFSNMGTNILKKIGVSTTKARTRFNSTSTSLRGGPTLPKHLSINNSLLSGDEKGQYTDMMPVSEFFGQVHEETHYMFPKHKAKFGVKTSSSLHPSFRKYRSTSRTPKAKIAEESEGEDKNTRVSQTKGESDTESKVQALRFQATQGQKFDIATREALENKAELEYLLQKSLKYHKEKIAEKDGLTIKISDEDKLNIIMDTWMNKTDVGIGYLDNIDSEMRMTSHMILNTRSNKSIYPKELKDAEIDIYLRNRKNVPKYELLQYMKFSNNENNTNPKELTIVKDPISTITNEDEFDINIG